MNINYLHTISSLSIFKGGPSRSVTGLCSSLADLNKKVIIITTNDSKEKCYPTNKNIVVYEAKKDFLSVNFYSEIKQNFYKKNPTLIHDHGLWTPSNFWSAKYARNNNIPYVLSPRGMLESWSLSNKKIKKKIALFAYQKKILNQVDVFFATSTEEAEQIRTLGFKQPIAIIPNGVEIPNFYSHQNRKNIERKNILFLSRIHPKKGLLNLVHAWNIVKNSEWRIQIAGNDENNHQQEVSSEIKRLNLEDDFEFLGSVDGLDKSNAYRNAELFILPTFSENFGIVVAEALSHGIPVITTTGTPWHSLIDNQCGWWVEPNVDTLASALKDAMSLSDEQRIEMGEKGINFVRNNFSWESIAKQTISVYEWINRKSIKPDCILD